MVRVLHLGRGGRLDYILFVLASLDRPMCSIDPSLFDLKSVQYQGASEIQREKFERSKNYFHRAETFVPQQPKYNRQFGNGGISGRVPYHLKREKHFYRSKC